MKLWNGYGSEHSSNIVLIGHFKTPQDASKTRELIDQLSTGLADKIDVGKTYLRFEDDVLDLLYKVNCHFFRPNDLEQFLYDVKFKLDGDKIIIKTEEYEISAFIVLMIHNGARLEIYSAHDYPDAKHGRGK
jgi:hypothetical protein